MPRSEAVRRRTRIGVALSAALITLVATATPAAAHNSLRDTDPVDGARLDRGPSSIVLTFDEPAIALGTRLVVTGPSGEVQQGGPELVDETVRQPLQADLPGGDYRVSWRVTSADGHPVSGQFGFRVLAPAGPSPSPSSPTATSTPTSTATSTATPDPTPAPTPADGPAGSAVPGGRGEDAAVPGWMWGLLAVAVAVAAGSVGYLMALRRQG